MSVRAAATTVHLPAPAEVREVLAGMVDRRVELRRSVALVPSSRSVCSVATYLDTTGAIRAVVTADRALTVLAGSALGLVPASEALDGLARVEAGGDVEDEVAENAAEVFNVLASVFNVASSTHVRLGSFHVAGSGIPCDVRLLCYSLGRREDHTVEIEGYGSGRLAVVLVP